MITINRLTKTYGAQVLFRDANLQLNAGNRYGIVGANGSGKSTLVKILAGEMEASEGEFTIPKRARIASLSQDHFQYEDVPIIEVVMRGNPQLWAAMEEKEAILARAHEHFDGDRYAELEDIVLQHDGYEMESRAGEVLEGLNIATANHHEPLSVLSGGFKLRVLLAQVLASHPDVLLLDEPTNHLDILSIRWLEKFLLGFRGCAVVVSHDQRFLNNVCTHILDVDYERVLLYPGDYDAFEVAKREQRERQSAEIARREKEISNQKAFIDRFRAKATKARQAQSRIKQVEKMVIEPLPISSRRYPRFSFVAARPSGKDVLTVSGVSKAFDDNEVLLGVSVRVRRGDRLAIIGPNGIGKSTLLKILVEELAADDGEVEWGHEVRTGYFPQDPGPKVQNSTATLQDWIWNQVPDRSIGYVRGRLAQVLFKQDDVDKRVCNLSGGELARLTFTGVSVHEPNVLVLDEPTNHLDLEGIQALADALAEYEGTVIFVAHNRWFVSRVATRILEIREDDMEDFPGSYEEYLAACGDDHLDVDHAGRRAREAGRKSKGS